MRTHARRVKHTMLLFLTIIAAVFVSLLLMAVVGALLPPTYSASAVVRVAGGVQRPWDALLDVERWPAWMPQVRAIRRVASTPNQWDEVNTRGVLQVVRAIDDDTLVDALTRLGKPAGKRTFVVRQVDGATQIELHAERPVSNVLLRFINRFIKHQSESEISVLESLARQLGERARAAPLQT